MRPRSASLAFVLAITTASVALRAQEAPPTPPAQPAKTGPKIQFAATEFDWGKAPYGEPVKCEFLFTNVGDELLEITGVQATCGCTALGDWSRQVEPGKTGRIPVQFNGLYLGVVAKLVTVTSNDKGQPNSYLQIKGTMWKRIDWPDPIKVRLIAASTNKGTTTARIINNMDEPVTLSPPESNNQAITAEIRTVQPGKEFDLIVTATPPLASNSVLANITIKTSSTNVPVINARAFAVVQPAATVTVTPSGPSAEPQATPPSR